MVIMTAKVSKRKMLLVLLLLVLAAAVLIGKTHMVKIDAAVCHDRFRLLRVCQVGFFRQNLINTPSARGAHGDHDEDHGEHHQRHQDAHDIAE